MPVVTDLLPAADELAGDGEIQLAVYAKGTGAGNEHVTTFCANELAVYKRIGMSCSGDGSTPIHNRVTLVTECTTGITVSGAGGSLIFHRLCSVDMPAGLVKGGGKSGAVPLGGDGLHCGCEQRNSAVGFYELTHLNIAHYRYKTVAAGILITAVDKCGRPYTDGKACDHGLAGQCNVAGCRDGDGCVIVFGIDGIFCSETICENHMIELPLAVLVEVNGSGYGAYLVDCGCNKIHPNNRALKNILESGICGNVLNGVLVVVANDVDGIFLVHIVVTVVVGDLEYYGMYAISKIDIIGCDHAVVRAGCVDLLAVNQNDQAVQIQAGVVGVANVIGCLCGEGDEAGIDVLTLHGHAGIDISVAHACVGDDGSIVVLNGRRIVYGNVIDIVNDICIVVGMLIVVVAVAGVVCIAVIETDLVELGYIGADVLNVYGKILPTSAVLELMTKHDGDCTTEVPLETVRAFGDIDPEGQGNCIGKVNVHALDLGLTPVHTGDGITINSNLKGILTVTNLRAVCCGSDGELVVEIIFIGSVATLIGQIPICDAVGAGLKIVYDLGTLAEGDVCGCSKRSVVNERCSDRAALYSFVRSSSELGAVNGTHSGVGKYILNIACLESYLCVAVLGNNIEANGLGVRCRDVRHYKSKGIGDNNVDGGFANDITLVDHLSRYGAGLAAGNKHTVSDRTHGAVCKLPGNVFGNFCRTTGRVCAGCSEGHSRTGGNELVISLDGSVIKLAVGNCLGHDDDTGKGGSFGTIGETALNGKFAGTLTFGDEGGGATAVAVDSVHATEIQHHLSHFVGGKAGGIRSHTAVYHHDNQTAVSLYANNRSGSGIRSVVLFFGQILAVFHQEAEAYGLSHPLITGQIGFRIAKLGLAVLVDDKIAAAGMAAVTTRITRESVVTEHLTLVNEKTIGVGKVPAKTDVHCTDNVFAEGFLNVCCLLGHFHNAPVVGIGIVNTITDIFKRRHDRNVVVIGVYLNNMDNLSSATGIIIENNFGFNSAGGEVIIVLLNEIVVVAATGSKIQLGGSRKYRHWQSGYNNQNRQYTCEKLFHNFFLLLEILYRQLALYIPLRLVLLDLFHDRAICLGYVIMLAEILFCVFGKCCQIGMDSRVHQLAKGFHIIAFAPPPKTTIRDHLSNIRVGICACQHGKPGLHIGEQARRKIRNSETVV